MVNEGIVLKLDGEFATVGVKQLSACDTCRAQCSGHCDKATTIETVVKNTLGAKVGDRVELYSRTSTVITFAIEVFVMPLVLAILGYLIPYLLNASSTVSAICAISGFILSFVILKILHGKRKSFDTIIMKRIIE